MKYIHTYLFTVSLAIIIISCAENPEKVNPSQIEYSWELVDSLNIDILGNPIMASVNESGSLFSFYDFPSSQILVTDSTGSILHRFSKTEDTPDNFGFMLDFPVIWGMKRVVQIGMNGIFIYDLEGNMIKKIDHPEALGGAATLQIIGKTSKIANIHEQEYILMKSTRTRDTYAGEQKFYDTYKALDLVNPETGEMTEMGAFESESKFLDGKGYIQSDYEPAFATEGNKLYLSHGAEPKMYVYELSGTNATLDTIISLNIPNFFEVEGKDRSEFSAGSVSVSMATAAIRNIFVQKGKIFIHYDPGVDPVIMEEVRSLFRAGKEDEGNTIYQKASSNSVPGILIYEEASLDFLSKIDFPNGTNSGGFLADKEFIYFQRTPPEEVEEDFLRIYKMKLIEK